MMKKDRNNLNEVENSNNENSKNTKKAKNKSKHKAIKWYKGPFSPQVKQWNVPDSISLLPSPQ